MKYVRYCKCGHKAEKHDGFYEPDGVHLKNKFCNITDCNCKDFKLNVKGV